jgi:hypothetical protein
MSGHWSPVHHEDDEPEPTPAAATAPRPETEPKRDEPARHTAVPMAMSLLIPPDFIAAISALVGTQAELVKQIDRLTKKIGEMVDQNEPPTS